MPPDTPIVPCPHGLAIVTCPTCVAAPPRPPDVLERCAHEFPVDLCPYCWRARAEKAWAEAERLREENSRLRGLVEEPAEY